MHVHVHDDRRMRTTIEITEAQRAELLKLGAERGDKGFSGVVRDALELYLKHHRARAAAVRAALAVKGCLDAEEGEALLAETRGLRERWR